MAQDHNKLHIVYAKQFRSKNRRSGNDSFINYAIVDTKMRLYTLANRYWCSVSVCRNDRSERLNIFERVRVPICRGSSGNFGHRSRSCRVASPLSAIISFGRMPLSGLVTSCRIIAIGESGQSNWHNCPPRKIDWAYRREGVNGKKRFSRTWTIRVSYRTICARSSARHFEIPFRVSIVPKLDRYIIDYIY